MPASSRIDDSWTQISRSSSCASSKQAAIACAHTMGQGDRHKSDQVAVEAMRRVMDTVPIDGTIVIGEGERDEAPMLYIGEKVGHGARKAPNGRAAITQVDIAVDPLEGTNLCATGAPNAIAVLAASEARRPAARARPLHGEAGRRPELEGRRRPRRAGRGQPASDRAGASAGSVDDLVVDRARPAAPREADRGHPRRPARASG